MEEVIGAWDEPDEVGEPKGDEGPRLVPLDVKPLVVKPLELPGDPMAPVAPPPPTSKAT